jgi:hypothetical protein
MKLTYERIGIIFYLIKQPSEMDHFITMRPIVRFFNPRGMVFFIFLLIILFVRPAASEPSDPHPESPSNENTIDAIAPTVDKTQEQISRSVISTALWFDSFFQDETSEVEINTTQLRIRMDVFQESEERTEFNFTPRLRLVLPFLQRKFHFEIMGSADEDLNLTEERETLGIRQTSPSRRSPTSGTLRYFIETRDRFNLSLAAGAFTDNNKPHFHFGPRARTSFDCWWWEITYTQWLRWLTNDGFESESRLDLDYELTERALFRTQLTGDWSDKEDEFVHSLGFLLYQRLSNKRVLAYEWNNIFTNRPNYRIEETYLRIRYRQQIWRDWLFAEVAPQLSFPRDRDFRRTPGILFRIESFFGFLE